MNAIAYEIRTKADIILKSKKITSGHLKFIIPSEDRRIFPKRILNEEIDINENNFFEYIFGNNWEVAGVTEGDQTFNLIRTIMVTTNMKTNSLNIKLDKVSSRFAFSDNWKQDYISKNFKNRK